MADERREDEIRVERRHHDDATAPPPPMDVREDDLEPHEGLRYIARLFKLLAVLLILLLVGEIIIGLANEGSSAIPTLMVEATRIIVFAGLLWGAADMALMLIESNHDLRATRILVGRMNARIQRLESATFTPSGQSRPPTPPPSPPSGPGDRREL